MKTKVLLPLLLAIASLFSLTSCNSDDNGSTPQIYLDIVTIKSTDAAGTVLTMRENGDSPLVTYTTTQTISGEYVKAGDRIIISYTAENGRLENGPINIIAAAPTIGKGHAIAEKTAEETGQWLTSSLNMSDIWRTGEYINLVFLSHSSSTPKKCELVVDKATLEDEYPSVYLIFEPGDGSDVSDYAFYMSYSITEITDHANCKGVTINYKSSSGANTSKQIEYTGGSFIRPEL